MHMTSIPSLLCMTILWQVRERCARETPPVRLVFIESICTDQKLLMRNYKLKASNDDYRGRDPEASTP